MPLPSDANARKAIPVYTGFIKYFPDAIAAVAAHSAAHNEQHNPGEPVHWDRSKSKDELDALMRHILDEDWVAVAWRSMANLQKYLEDMAELDAWLEEDPGAQIVVDRGPLPAREGAQDEI